MPAAFCGLLGFRPTHDAIPLHGVIPFAPSYDTIGWFARDAATLAAVGDVLLPRRTAVPIRKLLLVRDAFALADQDAAAALQAACDGLGVAGEVTLFEGHGNDWRECYRVLQGAEIWRELGPWITTARPKFGDNIAPRFADARNDHDRERGPLGAAARRLRSARSRLARRGQRPCHSDGPRALRCTREHQAKRSATSMRGP